MIETGVVPSEVNNIHFVFNSGRPMNTSNTPFLFIDDDECGNETPVDISSYDFEAIISLNGCEYERYSTLTIGLTKGEGDDNNKLWFDVETLNLDRGRYDYIIYFVDGVSVISGKIKVI